MTATETGIDKIAREILCIGTLIERGRDRLDFHEVGVIRLRQALEAAYEAGRMSAIAAAPDLLAKLGNAADQLEHAAESFAAHGVHAMATLFSRHAAVARAAIAAVEAR